MGQRTRRTKKKKWCCGRNILIFYFVCSFFFKSYLIYFRHIRKYPNFNLSSFFFLQVVRVAYCFRKIQCFFWPGDKKNGRFSEISSKFSPILCKLWCVVICKCVFGSAKEKKKTHFFSRYFWKKNTWFSRRLLIRK